RLRHARSRLQGRADGWPDGWRHRHHAERHRARRRRGEGPDPAQGRRPRPQGQPRRPPLGREEGGRQVSDVKKVAVELPAEIFDVEVNVPLIHQVVVAQQAAARQGTHATKTRGEVRGGGRKPYKQKGTGRARQGSTRAPQFTGGGTVHGPQPRSYDQRTPKKMKAAALRGALSDRASCGRVHVVTNLITGDTPKTKVALAALRKVTQA